VTPPGEQRAVGPVILGRDRLTGPEIMALNNIRSWLERQLANPQIVTLTLIVVTLAAVVYFFGNMLAPVFAALVIAYLLEGIVVRLERRRVPHLAAVLVVFLSFFTFLIFAVFGLLPLLIRQLTQLAQQVPAMAARMQAALLELPQRYSVVSEAQIQDLLAGINSEILSVGQTLLSYSVASLITVLTVGVYLILVPILVFFLLKDRDQIIAWFTGFLPTDRPLAQQVWREVDGQIGNYARGKMWEIFIVGSVTYTVFKFLGLQYSLLLAVITGFSVLIPYIGAFVVTLPVAGVAIFQWGLQPEFYWVLIAYGVIQFLDGNLLVPLLFSEAVNLHPVAIIAAILLFGGLWGFWGVFFAIPLATVIQAILRAWPAEIPTVVSQDEKAIDVG
jgi:putative permease